MTRTWAAGHRFVLEYRDQRGIRWCQCGMPESNKRAHERVSFVAEDWRDRAYRDRDDA